MHASIMYRMAWRLGEMRAGGASRGKCVLLRCVCAVREFRPEEGGFQACSESIFHEVAWRCHLDTHVTRQIRQRSVFPF